MKSLTPEQIARHAELTSEMERLIPLIIDQIETIQKIVEPLQDALFLLTEQWDTCLDRANDLVGEIDTQYTEFTDSKSDRWLKGKTAEKIQGWFDDLCYEVEYLMIEAQVNISDPEVVYHELHGVLDDWKSRPLKA